MSIIIYNSPQSLEPVYSPFYFMAGGFGTVNNLNFRYVYDIYVKDTTANTYTFVHREKQYPLNNGGMGIYSPARVVENYIGFNVNNLFNTGFSASLQSVKNYKVEFLEEWTLTGTNYSFSSTTNFGGYVQYNYPTAQTFIVGDKIKIDKANKAYNSQYDGIQTILTANTYNVVTDKLFGDVVSNESGFTTYILTLNAFRTFTGTCINFARQFEEREKNIPLTYNINPNNIGQPLTNHILVQNGAVSWNQFGVFTSINGNLIESSINLTKDEHYQVSWVANGNYYPSHMLIYTYNSLGNIMGIYATDYQFASNPAYCRFDFGVGPKNLENVVANNLYFPTTNNIFDENIKKMVFIPGLVSGMTFVQGGKSIAVNVVEDCSQYQQYRLAFLNKLGGFDIFRFSRKSIRKINIEREMFTKPLNWQYSLSERGETSLNNSYVEEITANSNWLTEKEAEIMEELFLSPEVFVVDDENNLIQPVVVIAKDFTNKTVSNNKLIQYSIQFRFANKNNLQRN